MEENQDAHTEKGRAEDTARSRPDFWFKKKIDTCASNPHKSVKLYDAPAQHGNLRQAEFHANLDYDKAPLRWAELRRRSNNGGGVPETPPTQQNRNDIQILPYYKNGKEFNSRTRTGFT